MILRKHSDFYDLEKLIKKKGSKTTTIDYNLVKNMDLLPNLDLELDNETGVFIPKD